MSRVVSLTDLPFDALKFIACHRYLNLSDRRALAQTCKAFQPLWHYEGFELHLGSHEAITGFNSSLHKHGNCIRKLRFLGLKHDSGVWDILPAPHALIPAYSCLRHLTELHCHDCELHLPALKEISPQLRTLHLLNCQLATGCALGQGTTIFAVGWGSLQQLHLTGCTLGNIILAACFPQLTELFMSGLTIRAMDEDGVHASMHAIAAGSAACTYLEFTPVLSFQHAPYAAFMALKRLRLKFDPPVLLRMARQAWDQGLGMPSTLTKLELMSASACGVRDAHCAEESCMDLPVVLLVALACIQGGASLRSITLAQCRTALMNEAGVLGQDPEYDEVVELYGPVGAALPGVTRLDVSASPHVAWSALDPLISTAPDLRTLEVGVVPICGFRDGTDICCAELHEVVVWYHCSPDTYGRKRMLLYHKFDLENLTSLRRFRIRVRGPVKDFHAGDKLVVVLINIEQAQLLVRGQAVNKCGWDLEIALQAYKQWQGEKCSGYITDFVYDGVNTWNSSVREEQGMEQG